MPANANASWLSNGTTTGLEVTDEEEDVPGKMYAYWVGVKHQNLTAVLKVTEN